MRAVIPDDARGYTPDHVWARREPDGTVRVGATPWLVTRANAVVTAVRPPPVGVRLYAAVAAGEVETNKSVVDVFAPCNGVVTAVNEALRGDPSRWREDPWCEGWLWCMTADSTAALWSAARYLGLVERR